MEFFKIPFNDQKIGLVLPWLFLLLGMSNGSPPPALVLVGPHFCQGWWPRMGHLTQVGSMTKRVGKDFPAHIPWVLTKSSCLGGQIAKDVSKLKC